MKTPSCIQCHDRPAKWKELKCEKNTYCGRLCQLQYHLVGLMGYGDDIVGLETQDGTRIRITFEQARQMETIDLLLEDAGHEEYIPLPEIYGDTLKHVENFLLSSDVKTKNMTDQQFIDLLKAANYLGFERLYMYLMPEWINKRPFPGHIGLKDLVPTALYFYNGVDFSTLNVNNVVKKPFEKFISGYRSEQWNIRMAARDGRLSVVKLLLKNGANPAAKDNFPLRFAALNGHLAVVELLLKNGADPTALDNAAIRNASENGHLEIVKLLLKNGADPAAKDNYALRTAAEKGYLEVVELLLKNGADPTAHSNDAIRGASWRGRTEIVKLLLKYGADPAAYSNEPIQMAAGKGYLEIVALLLKNGADPSANYNAPIKRAAVNYHLAVVDLLLQDPRVDPNALRGSSLSHVRNLYWDIMRKKQRIQSQIG